MGRLCTYVYHRPLLGQPEVCLRLGEDLTVRVEQNTCSIGIYTAENHFVSSPIVRIVSSVSETDLVVVSSSSRQIGRFESAHAVHLWPLLTDRRILVVLQSGEQRRLRSHNDAVLMYVFVYITERSQTSVMEAALRVGSDSAHSASESQIRACKYAFK